MRSTINDGNWQGPQVRGQPRQQPLDSAGTERLGFDVASSRWRHSGQASELAVGR